MQRVARDADDTEEPRQAFLGALLGPVEGRSLRVGVDQRDALALPSLPVAEPSIFRSPE
jgi:hypothetical protein